MLYTIQHPETQDNSYIYYENNFIKKTDKMFNWLE